MKLNLVADGRLENRSRIFGGKLRAHLMLTLGAVFLG